MTDPEAPISAPWWWSAVDGHLAPRIRSLATRMSVSETAVWAMAEVMVNRGFSSNMLERAFPELGPLRVKPWERRDASARALEGSPEAGDYLFGLHGAWIFGQEACRFPCVEPGLLPTAWQETSGRAPSHRDLVRRLLMQLATEFTGPRERLTQFESLERGK